MANATRQSVNPRRRCHRAWPMLIIGLAVMAGTANVSAQQYIAERINTAYQLELKKPLPKVEAVQSVAKAGMEVKSPDRRKENLPADKTRPILQPES